MSRVSSIEVTSGSSGELRQSISAGGVQNLSPGSARLSSKNSSKDGGRNAKRAAELVDIPVVELIRKLKSSGISEDVLLNKNKAAQ